MKPPAMFRRWIRRSGFDVIRFTPRSSPVARRIRLFDHHRINTVFDVGANAGAYGDELRSTGYRGKIISFEPLAKPFAALSRRSHRDPRWIAINQGLGAHAERRTINVAANTESSSFLPVNPRHVAAYPRAGFTGTEDVDVVRLDDVFDAHCEEQDKVYLKMDAQGFEMHILEGATKSLPRITGIQVELSLVPMYHGEARMVEIVRYLEQRGLIMMSVQPVIEDPVSGQLLQVDGLFFRDIIPA